MIYRFGLAALAAATLAAPTLASTTTFENPNWSYTTPFGKQGVSTYGQTFVAPGANLQSWTFYTTESRPGAARFVVSAWANAQAVGPALYNAAASTASSAFVMGGRTFYAHRFDNINLALTANNAYVAYITTVGIANQNAVQDEWIAISNDVPRASATNVPLNGDLRFLVEQNGDPQAHGSAWSFLNGRPLRVTATFGTAAAPAVPEPAAWALMIAGFGLTGTALRTRARVARAA